MQKKIKSSRLLLYFSIVACIAYSIFSSDMLLSSVYAAGLNCNTASNINVPIGDCQALVDLYTNTTATSSWVTNTNRVTDTNVCGRWGITCINILGQDRVTVIDLPSNGLNGSLSSTLSNLTELLYIDISDNDISGVLPNGSGWSNLQYMYFDNNQFIGSLPSSWSTLDNIVYIDLSDNVLSGPLPDARSALNTIIYFDISGNVGINGSLPTSWSAWTQVETFYASGNSISGPLPSTWSSLVAMLYFSVSNNQIGSRLE